MLLYEILDSQFIEDWFVDSMVALFRTTYDRAESAMNNTDDFRVAKRVGASTIGKWYSANTINRGQYDLQSLITSMKLPPTTLPPLIGKQADKEAAGYSSSANMVSVINAVIKQLQKRGKGRLSDRLQRVLSDYRQSMIRLGQGNIEEPVSPSPAPRNPTLSTQQQTAQSIVMDVISRLPNSVQHDVRTEVARRGNSLQALQQVLASRGLSA